MTLRKSIISTFVSSIIASGLAANIANAQEISINVEQLKALKSANKVQKTSKKNTAATYIVQLKEQSGVAYASKIGELQPSNKVSIKMGNNYHAKSAAMQSYVNRLKEKQAKIANEIGAVDILYNYTHTFNGFAAKLTPSQAQALRNHPDVVSVWEDEAQKLDTANTPAFLGLTGPGGQHTSGIKGDDVVVGIVDTGIWPENPSFADDGSYSDPSDIGWQGVCDQGVEADENTFSCNNKLIGARYFKAGFEASYDIQYALGEFESPRDADGHGSHTASTAAGNENVTAAFSGVDVTTVSGIAPRARIATYKVCWNSDYVSPSGVNERGCFYSDSMAAIDAATADGVDVINYSIGGSLTSLTTPAASAMLRAADAGVFVAVSAGNDGPTASTVGTPAPWVTSVAASTYDGQRYALGNKIEVTDGSMAGTSIAGVLAGFSPAIPEEGINAELAATDPILACEALDNPAEIAGKIALISRGSCDFTVKIQNAQDAGAVGAIVYTYANTDPFAMGGTSDTVTIPALMVNYEQGMDLTSSLADGTVNLTLSAAKSPLSFTEQGNVMADFSSRGPNASSKDIIKPDITAPGVNILAAISAAPMFAPQGEQVGYISGTSMAAPHIAGMAALLRNQYPDWSPAQIKSALMTTAYQNVTKEDGSTPADPFDFGSGHAKPVAAADPGLTYDLNSLDYLGFMCGLNEEAFVVSISGLSCSTLESAGFSNDPTQLNYPSIAVSGVRDTKTVARTVKDVSGMGGTYVATIEAPQGITIDLTTYDSQGNVTPEDTLVVSPDGFASYSLTVTRQPDAVANQWAFGSISWANEYGHEVRSPIAVQPVPTVKIDVPESLSLKLNRGRVSFPVQMLYTGPASIDYTGLTPAFGSSGSVAQDANSSFSFNEPGLGFHGFLVPEGTKVARFSLRDSLVSVPGTDLDMYVYRCIGGSCSFIDQSAAEGSNEDVIITNPEPANNGAAGDFYLVFVHGYDLNGAVSADYTMPVWIADQAESSTSINMTPRAIAGRFNSVRVTTKGLNPNALYMGAITFYNDEGIAEGTTVLEVQP